MKKFIILLLCTVFVFSFCGCKTKKTIDKESVKINLPKDDSVNGYRIESDTKDGVLSESSQTVTTISYFGNKNSKKFHISGCEAAKNTKTKNKVTYETRKEFIENGYTPCKYCNP